MKTVYALVALFVLYLLLVLSATFAFAKHDDDDDCDPPAVTTTTSTSTSTTTTTTGPTVAVEPCAPCPEYKPPTYIPCRRKLDGTIRCPRRTMPRFILVPQS